MVRTRAMISLIAIDRSKRTLLLQGTSDLIGQSLDAVREDAELVPGARDADVPTFMADEVRLARVEVKQHAIGRTTLRVVDRGRVRQLPVALPTQIEVVEGAVHENVRSMLRAIDGDHTTDLCIDTL